MELFQTILKFFNKPFPEPESLSKFLRTIVYISIFVTFFLYHFEPNGISNIESNKFLVCLAFGGICFVVCMAYELILTVVLKVKGVSKQLTFGKWILQISGLMLCLGLFNFLFARLYLFGYIDWRMLPSMLYGTLSIGIFPIVGLGAIALTRQERKYQTIANEINKSQELIGVNGSTSHLIAGIEIDKINYVEALQNYVKIGYRDDHDEPQLHTMRATLKQIQEEAAGTSIVKCHRSYLVNQASISSFSGNAQGLLLSLANCKKKIPVSRSYVNTFR